MRGPPWPTTPPDPVDLDEAADEINEVAGKVAEEYGIDLLELLTYYVETRWPGRSVVKILEQGAQA
jgi:hypothetical protein